MASNDLGLGGHMPILSYVL